MRKLLSVFLIFIIAISTVQLNIIAAEDIEYVPSPDAHKGQAVLNSLGIETIYDNYSEPATRGEMLSLIMQLMNTKNYSVDVSPFLDVSASEPLAAYAQTALKLGIISAGESFVSSRSILMTEAAKMGVVALGYANEAILMGGYPTGYLAQAQKLGLFDNMAEPNSEILTVGDMYVFLKNMTEADIRIQSSFGDNSQYTTTEGVNIITYYHDLYEINGIIEANEYTSLYDPDIKSDENCITVNSVKYRYIGELTLGENIKAYVKDTGSTDTIIYALSQDTEIMCVKGQNVTQIDGNTINFTNLDGKETKIKTVNRPVILYNGQASAKIAKLNNDCIKNAEITFISNDGDKVFDIISIMQSSPFMVASTSVQLSKIYGKNGVGTLTIDEDSDYIIYVDGIRAELSQIKENTIADVYTSENESLVTIKTSSNTVSGKITAYATNEKCLYIDDIKYEYTEYFEKYFKNNAGIGKEITAFLNTTGLITAAETYSSGSLKYGYFLQAKTNPGLDSTVSARIFTADGKYEVFTLADKVTIDSIQGVKPDDVSATYLNEEQLIRYGLSSDGKINKIDTQFSRQDRDAKSDATCGFKLDSASDIDSLIRYSFPGEDTTKTIYYKYNTMHPYFSLSATSIIFVVDKSLDISDEKRCMVKNRNSYANDQKFASDTIRPYNVLPNGSAEVMVEYSQASGSLNGDSTKYGVVQSFNEAVTPDGEIALKLVVYTNSRNVITTYLKDKTLIDSMYESDTIKENGDLPIGKGDFIRCAINTSNEITAIAKDYDYSLNKVINSFTGTNVERSDYLGYMYAYNSEDDVIFLANTKVRSQVETAEKMAVFTWDVACIFDSETGIVYPASSSDIISYINDPDNCDYVYLYTSWAQGKLAIVYR